MEDGMVIGGEWCSRGQSQVCTVHKGFFQQRLGKDHLGFIGRQEASGGVSVYGNDRIGYFVGYPH